MHKITQFLKWIDSKEKFVFLFILLINSLPIILWDFSTLDGVSHINNAKLANELLFQTNEAQHSLVDFNSFPVPNWTGQAILSLLLLVFSPLVADKIILLLIVILLPITFRKLIKTLDGNIWAVYLCFPFAYSFTFFFGFYNFMFGLISMFLFLSYFLKYYEKPKMLKLPILFSLGMLLYFSHLFVFIVTGMIAVTHAILDFIKNKKVSLRKFLVLIVTFIVPFILTLLYFSIQPEGTPIYLDTETLIDKFISIAALISFIEPDELIHTNQIVWAFGITLIACWGFLIYEIIKKSSSKLSLKPHLISVVILVLFILYFSLYDSNGWVGFISMRVSLLIYLFSILWIAVRSKKRKWLIIVPLIIFCYANAKLIEKKKNYFDSTNSNKVEMIDIGKNIILPNSLVLTENKPDLWFHSHIDNYLGLFQQNVFVFSNYEIKNPYFPIKSTDFYNQTYWNDSYENLYDSFDEVYVVRYLKGSTATIQPISDDFLESVYESEFVAVYRRITI